MNAPIQTVRTDVLNLESPLEALQASPDFRGPVEPLNGNHCNDHFALIYESREQQFAATVPFIRQGLERGERCMYVTTENSEDAVRAALAGAGVDVAAALESEALTFHSVQETYLRNGRFDADEMMGLYADVIEEATAEYEALRVTAEMTWILDADVTTEDVMTYESKVNELFGGEDAIALCQYDREAFPPEVLCDVVRVHPHLIYDTTVCHNFYYVPPEEFCGPEQPAHDLDRMLGTLLDRTKAKTELLERERRLERTIDRLEASNERLEQFAYAASHDLQEPLRMVSSYLQLIEHRAGDELSAESLEFLGFAVDGADRMREMIDGLLQYSRVEARGDPFESVDLGAVLEDVQDDLQLCIDESEATVSAGSLPRVEGDGNQLRQVFQNLLSNAITYSGDGSPRIDVAAERAGEEWVISVRDEGIGIEPGDQERIFDVFDRLHSRGEYDGTGIGLALCERIVERHGGRIWVESVPDEGSTFSFSVPVSADDGPQ